MPKSTILSVLIYTVASSAQADALHLLEQAQLLNQARLVRVEAELDLQCALLDAKVRLQGDGAAAPLEVDSARLEAVKLEALKGAIVEYARRLDRLTNARSPKGVATTNQTVARDSIEHKISQAHKNARGNIASVQAEVDYLEDLLAQLHKLQPLDATSNQEMRLTELKLSVAKAHVAMARAAQEYDATLAYLDSDQHHGAFPIDFNSTTIKSPVELATWLEKSWEHQKTQARRDALFAQLKLQEKYLRRLQEIDRQGLGRLGETQILSRQIANTQKLLEWINSSIVVFDEELQDFATAPSAFDAESLRFAWLSRRQELSIVPFGSLARLQYRTAKLREIAGSDPAFAEELRFTNLEADIAVASDDLRRKSARRRQVAAGRSGRSSTVAVSYQPSDQMHDFLAALHKEMTAEMHLAQQRAKLSAEKHAAKEQLYTEGHASWSEHAKSQRDLHIARAKVISASDALQIIKLELQRISAREEQQHERATTAMLTH